MSFLMLEGLTRQWNGQGGVCDIGLELRQGAFLSILGPSGCGKSTMLRLIAGLEQPQAGSIWIDGRDVTALPAAQRNLSMVFQSYALFPHLNVAENVIFGLKVRRVTRADRERRLAEVLAMTGLEGLERRKPSELSGGQRQRVALARAAVAERPLCLMDEPLSNLDAKLRHSVRRDIRTLARKLSLTVVYVTHDQGEAMSLSDKIVLMREGRIEQVGTPSELYARPATTFAAQFIGDPPMSLINATALGQEGASTIGMRPEAVSLVSAGQGDLDARIEDFEYLGGETRLALTHPAAEGLAAILPGPAAFRPGQMVGVIIPEENRLLFDSVTGSLKKEPQQNPKARIRQNPAPEDGHKAPTSTQTAKEDLSE
ncbi:MULTISPECIES: ABC transporter ATP-binding protein [unclassified Rhodosalinus]|uniref:ABC transporter ATP-binding protein n=1 Tax=unclassified Rhodosalinus TaxID=2630183 RepID=UPI0035243FBE